MRILHWGGGLASRNIQKVLLRCVDFCFFKLYVRPIRSLLSQRTPAGSFRDDIAGLTSNSLSLSQPSSSSSSFSLLSTSALLSLTSFYYIDTDEIPGFLLLLKNHIFTARSEDTIKIVSSLRDEDMIFYV